jgi:hypothetical protein
MKEVTCDGDTAVHRFPTNDDWDGKIETFKAKKQATATSTGGPAHSHIQGVHMAGGTPGNGPTFDLQDNNDAVVTVVVVGDDITVGLKTSGGDPVGTALETIDALNKNADVIALGINFVLPAGENGSGVVADSGPYTLADGLDTLDFATMKGVRHLFRWYGDYANGDMCVGFGFVSDVDWIGGPADLLKAGLTIQGSGYPLRHVCETP